MVCDHNAAAGWRPIETAPADSSVDLWCVHPVHGGMRSPEMTWEGGQWLDCFGQPLNPLWKATHWMPMPEPPDAPDVRDHNAATGWRAIETAPEHIYVLACVARPKMGVAENLPFRAIRNGPRWFVWGGAECFADEYPTHWMDLPEPPDDL